jgi:hypothetical protein
VRERRKKQERNKEGERKRERQEKRERNEYGRGQHGRKATGEWKGILNTWSSFCNSL